MESPDTGLSQDIGSQDLREEIVMHVEESWGDEEDNEDHDGDDVQPLRLVSVKKG